MMSKGRTKLPAQYLPGISDWLILDKPLKLVTPLEFQKIRAQKDYRPIDQTKHIIGLEDTQRLCVNSGRKRKLP